MGIPIKQRTELTVEQVCDMLKAQGVQPGREVKLRLRKAEGSQLLEVEWTAPERVERNG